MSTKTVVADVTHGRKAGRWAAWVAEGVERDRKMRKRSFAITVTVAAIVAVGLAAWLTIALAFP